MYRLWILTEVEVQVPAEEFRILIRILTSDTSRLPPRSWIKNENHIFFTRFDRWAKMRVSPLGDVKTWWMNKKKNRFHFCRIFFKFPKNFTFWPWAENCVYFLSFLLSIISSNSWILCVIFPFHLIAFAYLTYAHYVTANITWQKILDDEWNEWKMLWIAVNLISKKKM